VAFDAWGHSWGGPFTRFVRWGSFEQATVPTFGPPFLDMRAPIVITLGALSPLITSVGIRAAVSPNLEFYGHLAPIEIVATEGAFRVTTSPDIEIQARFASTRIDRDLS